MNYDKYWRALAAAAVLVLAVLAVLFAGVRSESPSPHIGTLITSAASTLSPTSPATVPGTPSPATPTPTLNASVSVCGWLVRWASDGNTQLARIEVGGTITEYRLQVGFGSASRESATGIPYLVRLAGRHVPADTGSAQAINLVDYNLTRVGSCTA
ncbi:MAG: hypothetical protein M3Z65_02245 [Chloroflexota bacterium]|nr:hypothetical protein [Chloroflexota bacterium]